MAWLVEISIEVLGFKKIEQHQRATLATLNHQGQTIRGTL